MIIYKVQNKINGKIYIGQTTRTLKIRIKEHMRTVGGCTHFHNAIKKYGINSFEIILIDIVKTQEELNKKEIYWISFYDCVDPKGYNLTTGGNQYTRSEETRRRMSQSKMGHITTEETKQKISKGNKGKIVGPLSSETKEKISKGNRGKHNGPKSEEHKQKISEGGKIAQNKTEIKRKKSESMKGKNKDPKSEEHKRKISESLRKRNIKKIFDGELQIYPWGIV